MALAVCGCGDGGAATAGAATEVSGADGLTLGPTGATSSATTGASAASGASDGGETGGSKFDVGPEGTAGSDGGCEPLAADATLSGTVLAPNLAIPVSGALVYASATPPEGIPQEVYCDECVALDCDVPYTLSAADGSFSLPVEAGVQYVVVQKGQFMRVTEVDVPTGATALGAEVTAFPDHNDPAQGLFIPKIALALGVHDRLEDALGKLGLADTLIDEDYWETFVPGTEQFDVWDNNGMGSEAELQGTLAELLEDYARLEQYHILFVPCSNDLHLEAIEGELGRENIRKWVAAGGKFYVADWSNEFLDAPFGQYQTFYKDEWGETDFVGEYDSLGTVLDPGLLAWLSALPPGLKDINPLNGGGDEHPTLGALPQIQTVDLFSGIEATHEVLVDDGEGGQIDVGHKVWIEGPGDGTPVPATPHPLTVTGAYGCGKIMFTTYHMAEFTTSYVGLTPQELVLLYLILELGVCQTPYAPPPT
ncbi:MAG: hypothetical protein R3A79_25175 [Nannocystaceae bacterium]